MSLFKPHLQCRWSGTTVREARTKPEIGVLLLLPLTTMSCSSLGLLQEAWRQRAKQIFVPAPLEKTRPSGDILRRGSHRTWKVAVVGDREKRVVSKIPQGPGLDSPQALDRAQHRDGPL